MLKTIPTKPDEGCHSSVYTVGYEHQGQSHSSAKKQPIGKKKKDFEAEL